MQEQLFSEHNSLASCPGISCDFRADTYSDIYIHIHKKDIRMFTGPLALAVLTYIFLFFSPPFYNPLPAPFSTQICRVAGALWHSRVRQVAQPLWAFLSPFAMVLFRALVGFFCATRIQHAYRRIRVVGFYRCLCILFV